MNIRVEYDGYNRIFKLVDKGMSHFFQDGETYLVVVDEPKVPDAQSTQLVPGETVTV